MNNINKKTKLQRLTDTLFSLDCFLFCLLTLGGSYPYESFSSAAYRAELLNKHFKYFRPVIDKLFFWEDNHCKNAYLFAYLNLPPDMRQK